MAPLPKVTTCRTCQAPIVMVQTEAGRRIPLDVTDRGEPRLEVKADGSRMVPNVVVRDGLATVLGSKADPGALAQATHVSHFATCVHAAEHKRSRPVRP